MNTIILFLSAYLGIGLTYYLKRTFEMNTVRASSISIIAGCCIQFLLYKAFPDHTVLLKVPYVVCGASFCGMSSSGILKNKFWAIGCGTIYTLIFMASALIFKGIGGGLGTGACLAVLMSRGLIMFATTVEKFILSYKLK